jgi:hypothetical protein
MQPSPIADAYVPAERLQERQDCYPLDLYLCRDCAHVQNLDVVNPELLFRDYPFLTSSSAGLVEHFRAYADDVSKRLGLEPGDLVVEIGSNDGSLLKFFRAAALRVVGVDPAREIARAASADGIPTLPEFFGRDLAAEIVRRHGPARLVVANNVFAHADDLGEMVLGVRALLDDAGCFVFEASYLVDIVERLLFDTVYHEHVSYHSVAPLAAFFERLDLELFDVQRHASKGGSLRGFVRKARRAAAPAAAPIVAELIRLEKQRGFDSIARFEEFAAQIATRKRALLDFLDAEGRRGELAAGYGASATVTTLLYQFDLTERLAFLADDNPRKHGRYSPGAHLPVFASDALYSKRPHVCVVLAWNYAAPILSRHPAYVRDGGRFVVPLPELRVVDSAPAAAP